MSDEIKIAGSECLSFGKSNIERSARSRAIDKHNKWKRAALSVCWTCDHLNRCSRQCEKVQNFFRDIEREDLITDETINGDYIK